VRNKERKEVGGEKLGFYWWWWRIETRVRVLDALIPY